VIVNEATNATADRVAVNAATIINEAIDRNDLLLLLLLQDTSRFAGSFRS
jgi:hypothetical protein